jgi:DNA topoisomerase-1
MELIITEKNIAAQQISRLLADKKPESDKVYNTPVYRFTRGGHECVAVGLKGHILGVDFPDELVYEKDGTWIGMDAEGEVIAAPDMPADLPVPPWKSKRKPFTAQGISLKGWKIPSLPYLTYAPLIKLPAEKDIIRSLKNLAKKADSIIIATDFDREGELIGLDAISVVRDANEAAPITRARYSAFVKKEIEEAFSDSNLQQLDYDLAHAGESRQYIDLIWGAVLTRYLTCVKYSGIGNTRSAGRVQTPTLALVVEREKEREAFIPEDYWVITGNAAPKESHDDAFVATHATARFKVEQEANDVMGRLHDAREATVSAIEKKRRRSNPPAPFNTTSLMAAASSIGIKPARTMRIAESLYMSGYTSYPRVDNTVYPSGLDLRGVLKTLATVPEFRENAEQLLANDELTPTRGKQETTDHPPIYPTGAATSENLRADEWKLYSLICRRFMATLSDAAVLESTKVTLDVVGESFTSRGDVLVYPGYRSVYQYGLKKDEQMPLLEEGQVVDFWDLACAHKQTEPPARYSSGKLIQEMEAKGLGTKATRHDMIERLYDRRYVVNDPIEPTKLGFAVIQALERFAPHITTPDMTAELESEMTQIADGKSERDKVVLHSRKLLAAQLEDLVPAKDEVAEMISDAVVADSRVGTCPKCGGDLCVKSSAKTRSSFVGCNSWPDCDVTYPLPQGRYEAIDEPCPLCGGPQVKVTPFRAKAYNHCLDSECESNKMEQIDVGECPVCKEAGRKGRLYAQKNPRTLKRFIRCENFEQCDVSYPLPQRGDITATGEVCDACGAPEVIISTARGPWRICVNMGCPKREQAKTEKAKKPRGGKKSRAKK